MLSDCAGPMGIRKSSNGQQHKESQQRDGNCPKKKDSEFLGSDQTELANARGLFFTAASGTLLLWLPVPNIKSGSYVQKATLYFIQLSLCYPLQFPRYTDSYGNPFWNLSNQHSQPIKFRSSSGRYFTLLHPLSQLPSSYSFSSRLLLLSLPCTLALQVSFQISNNRRLFQRC